MVDIIFVDVFHAKVVNQQGEQYGLWLSRVIDLVITCCDLNMVRVNLLGLVINNDVCIRGKSGCEHMIAFFRFHHEHSICAFCSHFGVSMAHTSKILSTGHLPHVGSNGVVHELLVAGYCFTRGWVHHQHCIMFKINKGRGRRS